MMHDYPAPIILEPQSGEVRACVIWLHGLGADGHDFEGLVPELHLPKEIGIRFVFPTARSMPVTLNMGLAMNAWYDIRTLQLREEADWVNIEASAHYILSLVEAQIAQGVSPEKILLAGFSQGGVVALHSALLAMRQFGKLAGTIALSCYYPKTAEVSTLSFHGLSILMAHGLFDDICPIAIARASRASLSDMGAKVDWHEYPMAHQVCADEIRQLRSFILASLGMELMHG